MVVSHFVHVAKLHEIRMRVNLFVWQASPRKTKNDLNNLDMYHDPIQTENTQVIKMF